MSLNFQHSFFQTNVVKTFDVQLLSMSGHYLLLEDPMVFPVN